MRRAFEVLAEMGAETSEDSQEAGGEGLLDDETLWEDLDDNEMVNVNYALVRHGAQRLSCFAHTLQLVINNGVSKLGAGWCVIGKCSKLANLVFREMFEEQFGAGASTPSTNATRWNSLYRQLTSVLELDEYKLGKMHQHLP